MKNIKQCSRYFTNNTDAIVSILQRALREVVNKMFNENILYNLLEEIALSGRTI